MFAQTFNEKLLFPVHQGVVDGSSRSTPATTSTVSLLAALMRERTSLAGVGDAVARIEDRGIKPVVI
jgi:hypothetical protein